MTASEFAKAGRALAGTFELRGSATTATRLQFIADSFVHDARPLTNVVDMRWLRFFGMPTCWHIGFAGAHGFRMLAEDNVATTPSVAFRVESFEPTDGFGPAKSYQTRLMWRDPTGRTRASCCSRGLRP